MKGYPGRLQAPLNESLHRDELRRWLRGQGTGWTPAHRHGRVAVVDLDRWQMHLGRTNKGRGCLQREVSRDEKMEEDTRVGEEVV